jgi:hypothetical protein
MLHLATGLLQAKENARQNATHIQAGMTINFLPTKETSQCKRRLQK